MHYKYIHRKIVIEKFIEGNAGSLPEDYKVYCFNGKPEYVMFCEGRELGRPRFYFFTRDWELARINKDSKNAPKNFSLKRPQGIDEIFDYAEKLSKPFPFVRVDFYLNNGKPVFGELTFVPAGGFDSKRLPETNKLFGDLLDITELIHAPLKR